MRHIRHDNEITHSAQSSVYDMDEKGSLHGIEPLS
jgi:hypothetical protein